MKRLSTYFLLFSVVCVAFIGCDYLAADDECWPIENITSCDQLNDRLDECDAEAEFHSPGCYQEEKCLIDTDSSSEANADGMICHTICSGDPVPCDVLNETECGASIYCQWYNDPNNIDKQLE